MNPLEAPAWYRVCDLAPSLRAHVRVTRHSYRGRRWYVLQDSSTGRNHRVDESAYQLIALMDGKRPLKRIWHTVCERIGDEAPTQDEAIAMIGQLHAVDVLHCDVSPDVADLFRRHEQHQRIKLLRMIRSPFFVRIPLFDPDTWLARWCPRVAPIFTRAGLIAIVLLIAAGALLAVMHREALVADATSTLLTPYNLVLLWLLYPLIKAAHEAGHALAVKHGGGEVHDVGIMLLVFMPVPYVDASTANAFESKWARVTVAGAGIAVELALASIALLIWLAVEPGLISTLALDVITIGGVSTLLFNGNPLLRFDGYYVLADAIEIPNLGTRANQYWGYLAKRYLLAVENARTPVSAPGERRWFVSYGLAAFVYRLFILAVIVLFVSSMSLLLGVVLGAWAVAGQLVIPALQSLGRLQRDPALGTRRLRLALVASTGAAVLCVALLLPAPHRTITEGIVWLADDTRVRTATDCFVEGFVAEPGEWVESEMPLLVCSEPFVESKLRQLETQRDELQARYLAKRQSDRAGSLIIAEEIAAAQAELEDARANASALIVRSPAAGRLIVPDAADLPGRFLRQGETFGYVIAPAGLSVHLAVPQPDIGLVRGATTAVALRLVERPGETFAATVARVRPGATTSLPGAALGTHGGGMIVADPADPSGLTAMEPVFLLELQLPESLAPQYAGARVHVRFDHGDAPLAMQWYRRARQLLLRRLAV